VRRLILTAVWVLTAFAPASAEVRILASAGGEVGDYLSVFSTLRDSGEKIAIDGPCLSACTLVLSAIPGDRICVTPRAIFGFHAAQWVDQHGRKLPAADATRLVTATYPAAVRNWINQHGGLTRRLILLRGRELTALFPACDNSTG